MTTCSRPFTAKENADKQLWLKAGRADAVRGGAKGSRSTARR
jgi:hypothetical protein